LRNRAERLELHTRALANQRQNDDVDLSVVICPTRVLFETARRYHDTQKWDVKMLLLMPDHLHMLVGITGNADLSNLVRDFKRITAKIAKIRWQRNSLDQRLRHGESEIKKFEYIRKNPVRAGLIHAADDWPYVCSAKGRGGSPEAPAGESEPDWQSQSPYLLCFPHFAMISSTICFGSRPRSTLDHPGNIQPNKECHGNQSAPLSHTPRFSQRCLCLARGCPILPDLSPVQCSRRVAQPHDSDLRLGTLG
jgi:REP element-mobilizing transposase RayT